MGLSQENTGPLKVKKIPMYLLTRAELLYTLCNEIPCSSDIGHFCIKQDRRYSDPKARNG